MSRILCILNEPLTAPAVLQASRLLLDRLGGRLQVLHPRPAHEPDFMPTEEVMTEERRRRFTRREDLRSSALAHRFEAWRRDAAIAVALDEIEGDVPEIVVAAAHDADLVVTGVACGDSHREAARTIQSLLTEASVSVIVVPEGAPVSIAARPGIAWKRGVQLDKAIDSALPLLASADEVHFLIGTAGVGNGNGPRGLTAALEQRGRIVRTHAFVLAGRDPGQALLEEARLNGCDLLIMGSHTHSWLRNKLIGGISDEVLVGLELPVLLHA